MWRLRLQIVPNSNLYAQVVYGLSHWLIVAKQVVIYCSLLIILALAYSDLRHRVLPNFWIGLYAFSFVILTLVSGFTFYQFGLHVLLAFFAFIITSIFFALRWMGGGDVKLWTAVMLWAGPHLALPVVIITTLAGGILGILGWLAAWRLRRAPQTFGRSFLRLISSDRGVPYGVALALAGLFVIYAYTPAVMRLN